MDLEMLLDAAARERTAADRDLLEHAGFRMTRIVDTASPFRLVEAKPVWRPTSLESVIPVGTSANWGFRGAVEAARMSRTTVSPCASVGGEVAAPASACGVGWLHASLCASQLVGLGLAFLRLHRPEVPGYTCERRARASRAALRTARCPDAFELHRPGPAALAEGSSWLSPSRSRRTGNHDREIACSGSPRTESRPWSRSGPARGRKMAVLLDVSVYPLFPRAYINSQSEQRKRAPSPRRHIRWPSPRP